MEWMKQTKVHCMEISKQNPLYNYYILIKEKQLLEPTENQQNERNIFTNYSADKILTSRIYKELRESKQKKNKYSD
jgi:hypothetical protein